MVCMSCFYFERIERHVVCYDLDVRNISPYYLRNSFRSEIKSVVSYAQDADTENKKLKQSLSKVKNEIFSLKAKYENKVNSSKWSN